MLKLTPTSVKGLFHKYVFVVQKKSQFNGTMISFEVFIDIVKTCGADIMFSYDKYDKSTKDKTYVKIGIDK